MMVPLFLGSSSSSKSDSRFLISNQEIAVDSDASASKKDIALYRQIAINFFCRARLVETEFPKALGLASATFADIINQKHGGMVEELPGKVLTPKQLYLSGEVQILEGSIKFCPDQVPEEAKNRFKEFIEKDKEAKENIEPNKKDKKNKKSRKNKKG